MIEVALLSIDQSLQRISKKNYRLTNLIKLEPTDSATTYYGPAAAVVRSTDAGFCSITKSKGRSKKL